MDFKNVEFLLSAPSPLKAPEKKLPEVLLVGRSNVGKSSLINALTGRKALAFVSSKPGHTKLLNYYLIDKNMYLVDSPGYGYSKYGDLSFLAFGELMESYFSSDRKISGVCLLLDSRRIPNEEDISIVKFFKEENIPFIIVLTKEDKATQSEVHQVKKSIMDLRLIDDSSLMKVSIRNKKGIELLRNAIKKFTIDNK